MVMTQLLVSVTRDVNAGAPEARPRPSTHRHPSVQRIRLPGARGARAVPSGPELTLERGGGLLERAGVGAGREILPAAVSHDEDDVGVPAGRDLLVGDAQRRMQDRARRDAGEDALALHQLPGAV